MLYNDIIWNWLINHVLYELDLNCLKTHFILILMGIDALTNQSKDAESFKLLCLKLLANPLNYPVFDKTEWLKPDIGCKVQIVSWDTQSNVQECIRLSKLNSLTIKDINPYIVGYGELYYWAYEIEVEESHLKFLQWHYKVIL